MKNFVICGFVFACLAVALASVGYGVAGVFFMANVAQCAYYAGRLAERDGAK